MRKLGKFINLVEKKGEKAHREAAAMGLKYKGFGYWVDPNSGQVTHKTEGDQLVAVEPDVETEKWQGDGPEQSGGMGPGGQMDKGGMSPMGNQPQMGMPIGSGQNVGPAGEPGAAQARKRLSWEPGPDGDTAVDGSEPPGDIPPDAFVGKTNYYQWVAGPKGTNYRNLSFDNIKNTFESAIREEEERKIPGARTMMRQAMGAKPRPATDAPFGRTIKQARDAVDQMKKGGQDVALGNQIASMMKIARKNKQRTYDNTGDLGTTGRDNLEFDKQQEMWKKLAKLPGVAKDGEAVQQMNKEISPLFSDPKFDLDQFGDDDFEEGGAFGQVAVTDDHVIKRGMIGPDEMKALFAMRKNPQFPTLVNGRFDGPFKHKSTTYNNPMGADNEKRPEGESQYWDPDEQSDFDDMYPTAPGTYAMTRAQGSPAYEMLEGLDDEGKEKAIKSFWRARAALHMAGFSHNDMHGGNIFLDEDGNSSIIDLGLAKDDPLSALMEGLGGADFEQGDDYQLSGLFGGSSIPEDFRDSFVDNMESVREMIQDQISLDPDDYDDYDADSDYSPNMTWKTQTMEDMMRGGIRMKKQRLEEIKEAIPAMGDREQVMKMIRALYKGISQSELEQRMANAFDKNVMSPEDQQTFRRANLFRRMRGEKPIVGKFFDIDD